MKTQLSLVALLSISLAGAAHADEWQPEPGFRSLFNGRDLAGWCFRAKADRNSPKVGDVTEKVVRASVHETPILASSNGCGKLEIKGESL